MTAHTFEEADIAYRVPAGTERAGSSNRMRIAYVHDGLYPYFKGGAERRLFETARALAERHDVTYITWQYWDGPPVMVDRGVTLVGVGPAPGFYGADGKRTVRESVAFVAAASRLLATRRFDIVDCCATPILAIYLSWLTSKLHRQPLVVTWHEFWGEYWLDYLPQRRSLAKVARLIESRAVPLADHLVSVSQFTARKLRDRGITTPISVVENGVSLKDIDRHPPHATGPEILFAGRLIDAKRVDRLIDAMAVVRQKHPGATCGIIGEGPDRARLEALVANLGLGDVVRFYGFIEEADLYGLMKAARVFAFPSEREGFGMAVAEAQACGSVPVVVDAPFNAAATLVNHGVDGLVSTASPKGLSDSIAYLLSDTDAQHRLAENARLTGRHRDWPNIASSLESVYANVLGPKWRAAA